MRRRDRKSAVAMGLLVLAALLILLGFLQVGSAGWTTENAFIQVDKVKEKSIESGIIMITMGTASIAGYVVYLFLAHGGARHGWRYALAHLRLSACIRKALLEGDRYSVEETNGLVTLPKIEIKFSDTLLRGTVQIENRIKYADALDNMELSSALGRYRVVSQYLSNDHNCWIFEIEDASVDNRITYHSYSDLRKECDSNPYQIVVDKNTVVPIVGTLICGSTGSGKSYAVFGMVLQLVGRTYLNGEKAGLYFADPKMSGLYTLGRAVAPEHTGARIEEIVAVLEQFYEVLSERQRLLAAGLEVKGIDADYRDFGLPPMVLILEEYSSFASLLSTQDKQTRDRVNAYIKSIVQMGRQLGCFIWIVMQKSDATTLPTDIRTNLPLKVVLGSATDTTYLTAFELTQKDIPKQRFRTGEGLYAVDGSPLRPCTFPELDFDILAAIID